ncbi:MAG TPA: tyrosine-type recombinase/integrase, partial [Nonomuraea sp.]|nr:tyrosine-type recombinase/integrase [Nonomuraea sp.]
ATGGPGYGARVAQSTSSSGAPAPPGDRTAELFETATGGWTLHQLRHSALTHAAEDGANTSTLLAYSGHTSVASLARYARVSGEALARWQAGRDPASRRR